MSHPRRSQRLSTKFRPSVTLNAKQKEALGYLCDGGATVRVEKISSIACDLRDEGSFLYRFELNSPGTAAYRFERDVMMVSVIKTWPVDMLRVDCWDRLVADGEAKERQYLCFIALCLMAHHADVN